MTNYFKIIILGTFLFLNSILLADDAETTVSGEKTVAPEETSLFYLGLGSSDDSDPYASDSNPWAIGFMVRDIDSSFGFDIAGEGTMLDSTYGQNDAIDQGFSYNFIAATKISGESAWRVDLGLLLGARETSQDCPDSYLGYACYADQTPDAEYEVNYGAVMHITTSGQATFGFRVTGESTQFIFGFNF